MVDPNNEEEYSESASPTWHHEEADDVTESPRKTKRNIESLPSHVKKRLSKIVEDENGDEDGGQPRPED